MAITNAQQYKQLVNPSMDGKRPGYRGSDYASIAGENKAANTSAKNTSGADYGGGNQGGGGSGSDGQGNDYSNMTGDDVRRARREYEIGVSGGKADIEKFKKNRPEINLPNFSYLNFFKNPIQKFADFTAAKNRPFFEDVIRAGKLKGVNFATVSDMSQDELEQAYKDYMSERLAGNIDAYGNPLMSGDDDPFIPINQMSTNMDQAPEEEVLSPIQQAILDRGDASAFLATGGRVGLKGGADASQFDKSPSEQRSVDISPSGSVTLGSGPPEGPDDRGSDTQNAVQAMVRAGFTPKEINAITNPTVFDKVKQSRFNNPLTRGILRTGAYLYNPSLAGIDFRRAMQAKDLYDYTMNQINNPQITEEDMQFAKGGRAGFKGGTGITDRLVSLLGGKNMAAAELGLEGLNQIYQLLQMPGLYAKGGRAGFFMGSTLPKGLATLRQMLNYMGNKSDKVQYPSDVLKMVNPKSLNKMLEDPRLQGKVNIKEGIMASDMVKNFQSKMGEDRVQLVRDMLDSAKNIKRTDDKILAYKNEIKERMMKELNMSEAEADRAATAMSRLAMDITKMPNTPKLTDEGILELENVLKNMETGGKKKRDLNADGGRIGLKDGMNRRTFLKLLGGLAAIPIVGKIIKPLKTVKGVKNVPIIKTDAVPGKPEWFDQLVNKVIIEGEDVTKKLATVEREIVHTKKINNTDEVTVYQDLNTNSVRVEYKSPDNMMEEPVDLSYKRTPPDEGAPRGDVDFEATEMGYVGRADGPDDYFIDAEEVGGRSIKDLDSDVSALKEYATGQKPTIKEILQKKKRKDKVKKLNEGDLEAQSDYITARQGDAYDYDDYASGGIARMLGE